MRRLITSTVMGICGSIAPAADLSWELPEIAPPQIPDRTFSILDYGAVGDGKTSNTKAISDAIAAASQAGGGKVVVPGGTYLTGPIRLASHLNLHLNEGAILRFSDDKADYPLDAFAPLPARHQSLITGDQLRDVMISGSGTFDGQGQTWWQAHLLSEVNDPNYADARPKLLAIHNTRRLRIEGVTFTNSPMFHMSPTQCEDVVIDGVTVLAPPDAPNTDSCNPSGWNYIIKNCTFDVGDDNIAVKPFKPHPDGRPSVENLFVMNCTFRHGHGLSIGGQTYGGLRNMHVRDCTFDSTDSGIRMKSERGQGSVVENVTYENITMKNVKLPINITSYYHGLPKPGQPHEKKPIDARTPIWRDILISDLKAVDCAEIGLIMGLPEMPVQNLTLRNVSISAGNPLRIGNVKGLRFENVKLECTQDRAITYEETVEGEGLPGR